MEKHLLDFQVLSFDCYGTLIDWETGIWDALQPLLMQSSDVVVTRREALAVYGELEHRHEADTPAALYRHLLADVHRNIARHFELPTSASLDQTFAESVQHWPAFADTAEALRVLKQHFKLVILSNVDHQSFAASARKLGVEFDALYLAEDIGSYKPDERNFEHLLTHTREDLDCDKAQLLHVAQSLLHDHQVANQHAISNAWIDRQRLSESGDWGATKPLDRWPNFDFQFFTMRELAEAVTAEEIL